MLIVGPIINCALMDRWVKEARDSATDPEAFERLRRLLPRDVPADARKAYRTACIRRIAARLRKARPEASEHRIAVLIELAGQEIEQGRALRPEQFDEIDADDLAAIEDIVRDVLSWMPAGSNGRWLGRKRIAGII